MVSRVAGWFSYLTKCWVITNPAIVYTPSLDSSIISQTADGNNMLSMIDSCPRIHPDSGLFEKWKLNMEFAFTLYSCHTWPFQHTLKCRYLMHHLILTYLVIYLSSNLVLTLLCRPRWRMKCTFKSDRCVGKYRLLITIVESTLRRCFVYRIISGLL